MNPNTFRHLSYGVYVISTWDGNRPTGCAANSAMQITSEPATIAISINHNNYTNGLIDSNGKFAISILNEESDSALIGRFGFQSGKDTDKFAGIEYETVGGLPVLTDTCGYIICKVVNKMETATHTVFLGEVIDAEVSKGGEAMTYAYYHKVVKGKSPKNAPTYLSPETEVKTAQVKYICKVCAYVHEGEMPDDFKCPICGVGKERFEI
ncbi:MAG: flavin reductase [Lachnospiraceae bacterium]|nr:flavin reductase [Lachnospiraceae bacterium]